MAKGANWNATGGNTAPRGKGSAIGLQSQKKAFDYNKFGSGPGKSTGTDSGSGSQRRNPAKSGTFMNK